jgi:transposase
LQARFLRHRGPKRAVVALAHTLLRIVYHVLADGTTYHELGGDYYDRQHSQRLTRRAIQLLERQGYRVTLASTPHERVAWRRWDFLSSEGFVG